MTDVELPNAAVKIKQTAEQHGWRVLAGGIGGEKPGVLLGMRRGRGAAMEHIVARWDNPRRVTNKKGVEYTTGDFAGAWQKWKPEPPEGGVSPRRLSSEALAAALAVAS